MNLIKGLEIIQPHTPDCIWAKWSDNEGNATVIGIIYIPPGVPVIHDPMIHIKTGLLNAPPNARIVLLGDMNARIGNFEPMSVEPSFKHADCIPEEEEWEELKWKRCLRDVKINQFGRELNRIASWSGMECINGTHKETQETQRAGSFTCFTQIRHPSVVDQAWCTSDHKNSIISLQVLDFMPDISDHCPISLTMDGHYHSTHQEKTKGQDKTHDTQLIPQVTLLRAEWTDEEATLFMYELGKRERKKQGENIAAQLQHHPSRSDINLAIENINKVILTSMETTCQTWTVKKPNPEGTASKSDQPWFNRSCENAKVQMRNWARLHQSVDLNQDHIYYGLRTQYKQIKKRAEKQYRNDILSKMAERQHREPRQWWTLLRKLNYDRESKQLPTEVSIKTWADHFRNLLNAKPNNDCIDRQENETQLLSEERKKDINESTGSTQRE